MIGPIGEIDANGFCSAKVEVRVSGFLAQLEPFIQIRDLVEFRKEILALYEKLEGVANFSPLEKELELRLAMDARGQVSVTGKATKYYGERDNQLTFELSIDQTFLPSMAKSIERVVSGEV